MGKLLKQFLCAAAFLAGANTQAAVTNGDFETGNLDGWTLNGSPDSVLVADGMPLGGTYSAFFTQAGAVTSIAQSLSTVAGQSYVVSFWLANLGGGENNDATVATFEAMAGNATPFWLSDKAATGYVQHQLQFTATSSSTELVFSARHDENFWVLDDIVVSAVPEPATVLMLFAGLGLLAAQRRRNRAI